MKCAMFIGALREHAINDPDRLALQSRLRTLTYAALVERVNMCASALRACGVSEETVVGLSVSDEIEHLVACLSLLSLGATQITLATFDSANVRQLLAAAAGVDLILSDHANQSPPDIRSILWNEVQGGINDNRGSESGRLLLRTSGTTSDGKIVQFDQEQLALQGRHIDQYRGHRYLRPASVEHNNGKRHRLYCLYAGGTNLFRAPTDTNLARVCRDLAADVVDLSMMHAQDLIRQDNLGLFQNIVVRTAGSPLPLKMRQQIQDHVSRHLYVRYGATECGSISMAGPEEHDADEVVGLPAQGADVEIVDADGDPVLSGKIGAIRIRAPGMADGYRNSPLESQKRFVDGWFWPGDIGRIRSDGRLIIAGRSDEMMILNGMNIFPQEIERVLELHPAVKTAGAVPLASAVHGQIPVAAVELEPGATVEAHELLDFARKHLGLRAPRRVLILPALPRAAEGKLLRRVLVHEFQPQVST